MQGDLWALGNHKLLVGDATDQSNVARPMASDTADFVFVDTPYNVDYEGYTKDRLKIQGDRMTDEQFNRFLEAAFRSCRGVAKPGASLYVCHSSSRQREFQNALEGAGFEVRCQIIWAKNTFAWGFGRYKFRHEPIFYAHVAGEKDPWYGDKSQSTLWEEKKPAANRMHLTMKPVELIERAFLIACERRNRAARRVGVVRNATHGNQPVLHVISCRGRSPVNGIRNATPAYSVGIVARRQRRRRSPLKSLPRRSGCRIRRM